MARFLAVAEWLLDWCFPFRCIGCGREGAWVCQLCATELQKLSEPSVPYRNQRALYPLASELVRDAVHHLKYLGADRAVEPLLIARQDWIKAAYKVGGAVAFVPVPLSSTRRKERGYNQAELVARQVAGMAQGSVLTGIVSKHSGDRSQVGQGRQARQQAAAHNFYLSRTAATALLAWRHCQLIVVDDVVTTGSTLAACCGLLQPHSRFPVQGLALAYQELGDKKKHP